MSGGFSVVTEPQTGGAGYPLHTLGVVGDLTYSSAWGGGCLTAEWNLAVPVSFNHLALTPGRRVRIFDGVLEVWRGILSDSDRGAPWKMHARGLSTLCAEYAAISSGGSVTADPNTAVDQAIIRGLPISRLGTLPAPFGSTVVTGIGTVADLLNLSADQSGRRWGVWADGFITQPPDPTTPDYLVVAVDTPGGRTVDDYATHLYGAYMATGSTGVSIAAASNNPTVNGPFGRYERVVDLTSLGEIDTPSAQAILAGMISSVGPRAGFTGTVTAQYGAVLSPGGVPVRLSTVRAGKLFRFIGCVPDPAMGELSYTTSVDVMMGQVDYDTVAETVRLQPVGLTPRDLRSILTAQARPDSATLTGDGL